MRVTNIFKDGSNQELITRVYGSANGQCVGEPFKTIRRVNTYVSVGITNNGLTKLDFTNHELVVTLHSPLAVKQHNDLGECGKKDWALNQPKTVDFTACTGQPDPGVTRTVNIVTASDVLFVGDFSKVDSDGRPTDVDVSKPFYRESRAARPAKPRKNDDM